MKKHIITLLICSVIAGTSAQNYTQAFDSVFQHVDLSHTSTGILYERVLPISNLINYVTNIPHPLDTCNYWQFIMAYDEIYRAGANNTFLSDSVEEMIGNLPTDNYSVVIGMLHADFNTFDTSALRQKLYFDADSVLWENTAVNISLFSENTAFMMSPLVEYSTSTSIRFIIDQHFFFDNTSNPVTNLRIDFGDGYGERAVALNSVMNILYPSEGIKIIRITSTFQNGSTLITFAELNISRNNNRTGGSGTSSYAYTEDLTVTSDIHPYNPYIDSVFATAQGDIRIYYANSDMRLRKPVLIVDGFDPLNNRRFDTCYAKGEKSLWEKLEDGLDEGDNVGEMLLDLGYDVVLLDLPDGGTYIEENAMVCIAAINKINELLQQSGSNEQIVVVGPSMGGQITRYALDYMEQHPNNANTNYGNHNCRLWVSFDSPHQGANISMGVQAMVESYKSILSNLWNNTLCCKAAQQMLIYHKKNGSGAYNHLYYQQITNLGYPSIRKIAVSNGSLNNISNGVASSESLAISAAFPYLIDVFTRNMAQQGPCKVYEIVRYIGFIPIPITWTFTNNANKGSLDIAPGCKYNTFDIIVKKLLAFRILGLAFVNYNQHSHCFMPITSVLDINENISYATDISNRDLVAEGKVPFDSYWGPLNKNMEHITFDYDLVDYLLNEIETYIQGPREVRQCTHPSYTMHLPLDANATVTWLSSPNIHVETGNDPYTVSIIPLDEGDGWISANVTTLKHNKRLANYPIHILPYNDNTIPTIYSTTITGSSMTISTDTQILDTFCIESGKTLTVTGTLYCAPGTRLIVRPGGKLVVDGGTLTSACDGEMWQGIEVVGDRTKQQLAQYQGKVELRNEATIENAWCGIRTGLREDTVTFATTGGIIIATDATFKNNRQSVVINSYAHTAPSGIVSNYNATFSLCTLVVDNSNLFAANNTSFAEHVRLWDVKGVGFLGCTFANQTNSPMSHGSGIHAEDAGFSLGVKCAENYIIQPGDCGCPPSLSDTCSFSGFNTAVLANTTGNPYAVTADRVRFSGNGTGIRVNGNDFVTVTRCTFDQTTWPESVRDNYGLYLNGCTGYKVEENTFMRTTYPTGPLTVDNSTGICVKTSGITNNSLYRNNCEKLTKGIHVVGQNGLGLLGLRMTCNHFSHGQYDIYIASKAVVASEQGSSSQGADNTFAFTQNSSFYNLGWDTITYFYKNYSNPISPYRIISNTKTIANNCPSTLCNGGGGVYMPLAGFSSQIETHATAAGDATTEGTDMATQQQSLSETYYKSVRAIMSDSLLDLNALEQWHTAAQPIADPYSLTETRFCEGYSETFAAAADDAELSNYAEFHALKLALRNNDDTVVANYYSSLQPDGHVNWYAMTPTQIAQLQTIAERNTGRASVMAKGVLCFFFGICYDDEVFVNDNLDNQDNQGDPGTRSAKAAQQDGETSLIVYPNPTDDLLYAELREAEIASVALYDLQGRVVETRHGTSLQGGTATVNMRDVPTGVYVLRVTDENGREYHQKIVKK